MALNDAALAVFEALTRRPFLVIDTEYEPSDDGNHLISLAIVPVIRGKKAPAADELYIEVNPGVPIADVTSTIHGFTDASVARKKPFAHHASRVLEHLGNYDDAILVSHTGVDVHLLRDELARLDELGTPNAPGLDDLPSLPLIDTSTLPRLVRLGAAAGRPAMGLSVLCDLLGVTNTSPHHARHDARATAAALMKLLLHAAERLAFADIDELLTDHDRGTTHEPRISIVTRRQSSTEPSLPGAHLARHTQPLLDPASAAELDAWQAGATECVRLRCRHLADSAELAARENGPAILNALTKLIAKCDQPGQAGTLLGAIKRVVAVTDATTPPITAQLALRWLAQHQSGLAATPPCAGHSGADACPDCRDHAACPRDTLHHPFVHMATLGLRGALTEARINDRLIGKTSSRPDRAINAWGDRRNIAYMLWVVITWERQHASSAKAATHLQLAIERDLHLLEPRLTLLVCDQWAQAGRVNDARSLAIDVTVGGNTDPAFQQLRDWLAHTDAHHERRMRSANRKPVTHPRLARPAGRTNPNPYQVG